MTMIDERSRRKPDWVEGVPITLEDGQTWHFPRPIVGFRIAIEDLSATGGLIPTMACRETSTRFGQRFKDYQDRLFEAYLADAEPDYSAILPDGQDVLAARSEAEERAREETIRLRLQSSLNVAGDLLTRNYRLDDVELSDLLLFYPDDANREIWDRIRGVAMGTDGPKPDPDGGTSSPS